MEILKAVKLQRKMSMCMQECIYEKNSARPTEADGN